MTSTSWRVLIADDDKEPAWSLAVFLKMDGHEVCTALDGDAALQVAESFRPDVVIVSSWIG